jgi:hypothetical protein
MYVKDELSSASNAIGEGVSLGLVCKTGRLKKPAAEQASDVVGFDYKVFHDGVCYKYYAANPPLTGMTQPKPTDYPLGLAVINEYKIEYQEAIDIFHKGNWGSKFTSISLSQPLYPGVNDPSWYFVSDMGVHVVINANTGETKTQ